MKPYNERLPMIDEAIDEHNGVYPRGLDSALVQVKHSGRWVYATVDQYCGGGRFICTRQEFEQRVKELQNKPSWDDSPQWANWLAQDADGSWHFLEGKPRPRDDYFANSELLAYQHKGIGIVIGNWQDTLEQRPETKVKEQDMNNDWYEKGELPPVGEKCTSVDPSGIECSGEVVKHHSDGECALFVCDDEHTVFWQRQFLPLRTEMDKLVEQMADYLSGCELALTGEQQKIICNHLVEKGYRKIKPMTESEFVFAAINFGVSGQGAKHLFNQGCRFIEQGE